MAFTREQFIANLMAKQGKSQKEISKTIKQDQAEQRRSGSRRTRNRPSSNSDAKNEALALEQARIAKEKARLEEEAKQKALQRAFVADRKKAEAEAKAEAKDKRLAGYEKRVNTLMDREKDFSEKMQRSEDVYRKVPFLGGDNVAQQLGRKALNFPFTRTVGFAGSVSLGVQKVFAGAEGLTFKETRENVVQEFKDADKTFKGDMAFGVPDQVREVFLHKKPDTIYNSNQATIGNQTLSTGKGTRIKGGYSLTADNIINIGTAIYAVNSLGKGKALERSTRATEGSVNIKTINSKELKSGVTKTNQEGFYENLRGEKVDFTRTTRINQEGVGTFKNTIKSPSQSGPISTTGTLKVSSNFNPSSKTTTFKYVYKKDGSWVSTKEIAKVDQSVFDTKPAGKGFSEGTLISKTKTSVKNGFDVSSSTNLKVSNIRFKNQFEPVKLVGDKNLGTFRRTGGQKLNVRASSTENVLSQSSRITNNNLFKADVNPSLNIKITGQKLFNSKVGTSSVQRGGVSLDLQGMDFLSRGGFKPSTPATSSSTVLKTFSPSFNTVNVNPSLNLGGGSTNTISPLAFSSRSKNQELQINQRNPIKEDFNFNSRVLNNNQKISNNKIPSNVDFQGKSIGFIRTKIGGGGGGNRPKPTIDVGSPIIPTTDNFTDPLPIDSGDDIGGRFGGRGSFPTKPFIGLSTGFSTGWGRGGGYAFGGVLPLSNIGGGSGFGFASFSRSRKQPKRYTPTVTASILGIKSKKKKKKGIFSGLEFRGL